MKQQNRRHIGRRYHFYGVFHMRFGIKEQIEKQTLNSSGVIDISRNLGISENTVISELKKIPIILFRHVLVYEYRENTCRGVFQYAPATISAETQPRSDAKRYNQTYLIDHSKIRGTLTC